MVKGARMKSGNVLNGIRDVVIITNVSPQFFNNFSL